MKWSRYNLLFKSEKFGHLLYNSLSNTFAEVDAETARALEQIRADPEGYDFRRNPALLLQLRQAKVLVDDGEEEALLDVIRLKKLLDTYDTLSLYLTIAPTLACNFRCTYCFERSRRPIHMDEETQSAVVDFIRRFGRLQTLHLGWFGGEPLLRFDTMCRLTGMIRELGIPFSASLVTNGYLLEDPVIDQLGACKIELIQVTIDGPEEVHNRRRIHATGAGTYSTIVGNLERLVQKWHGRLSIRVNVDKSNMAAYGEIHRRLSRKFEGRNVGIHHGIVEDSPAENPDLPCEFSREDEADFCIDLYRACGVTARSFYPKPYGGCVATIRNGVVVGPKGELYNCWHDVGDENMVIGTIFDDKSWDMSLLAKYTVGINMYDDPRCRDCFCLPVCDGGCPHFRLRRKYRGENRNTCMTFKDRLPEALEIHYEIKQKQAKA